MIASIAVAVALASLALMLHGRRFGLWRAVAMAPPGAARHRYYARLVFRVVVHFGLMTVLLLAGTAGLAALWRFPAELEPARAAVRGLFGPVPWWTPIGGVAAGVGLALLLEWRGRRVSFGNVGALAPARRGELGWGVLLSLVAGVVEEMFFRLLLPLLIVRASGSAAAGFAVAALLFGYAHRYQGIAGVAGTAVAGVLLTLVYLLAGQLWIAMAVHVVMNLNGLVLRPLVAGRLR